MRKRFTFWLNDKRDEDIELNNLIEDLKQDRLFSRAIREGLRMWIDNQSGNTPAVKSTGGAGELDEIKSMLEMIVTQQKNGSGYLMQSASPPTTGKMLGGFKPLSAPVEDDDLPTLAVKKNTSVNSSKTFLEALRSMQ